MSKKGKKIVVVGVGNILMKDEGLGVHTIERLRKENLPDNIELYDAGTSLHLVLGNLEGFDKMIIVDAVKAGSKPATIHRFTLKELEGAQGKNEIPFMLSLHDLNVPYAFKLEKLVSRLPEEVLFIGMEPEKIEPGLELSKSLEEEMEHFLKEIEKEFH